MKTTTYCIIYINLLDENDHVLHHLHKLVEGKRPQRKIVDLKILKSDWLRAFWLISQDQDFSRILELRRNTINNINFCFETTNLVKINSQIFLQIRKTFFLPISRIFGSKKSGIVTTSF